jgi:hypothetical protein
LTKEKKNHIKKTKNINIIKIKGPTPFKVLLIKKARVDCGMQWNARGLVRLVVKTRTRVLNTLCIFFIFHVGKI